VERFNRSFREEMMDAYAFETIRDAQKMAHAWLWMYNNERPHSSLGYKNPVAFLDDRRKGFKAFPSSVQNDSENWKSLVLTVIN
jgi:putative transposase